MLWGTTRRSAEADSDSKGQQRGGADAGKAVDELPSIPSAVVEGMGIALRKGEDRGATPLQRALATLPPGGALPLLYMDESVSQSPRYWDSDAADVPAHTPVISHRKPQSTRDIGR